LLQRRGVEFDTIEYLKNPADRAELERISAMLEAPVTELVRQDKRFDELQLKAGDYTTKDAVIALLVKYPELMQRPIVIRAGRALIARPAERLNELF
jgi:arsenate reductase (glutaredoxin)